MEEVLDLYAAPPDPRQPVVCFDELPYGLTAHTRAPLPPAPGQLAKEDYEYSRQGSCALLALFCPAAGWRRITVRAQRTKREVAEQLRLLVEECFPEAERIHLVLDNLNTHTLAALYEVYPAEQARQIVRKLELHFTPKHGSWLNLVEIEWSLLARQCLRRRLPDLASVQREVEAWAAARNAEHASVDWRFTPEDARTKMQRLYTTVHPAPP
jgi:hypothetical protein